MNAFAYLRAHRSELRPQAILFLDETSLCLDGLLLGCDEPLAQALARLGVEVLLGERPAGAAPPPEVEDAVQAVAEQLILLKLRVPLPDIELGPDPSVNEWNTAIVGLPVWLWTAESPSKSAVLQEGDYEFRLDATRRSVTFDPGDGSAAFTCTEMPEYSGVPGSASPSCGHTFLRPGRYTVRATARWSVAWSALGYSGVLPMTLSASRPVVVGELQSIREG